MAFHSSSLLKLSPLAALALMTVGCADEQFDGPLGHSNVSIIASIDEEAENESRTCIDPTTYLGNTVGVLWTPDDTIGVFGSGSTVNAMFLNNSKRNAGQTTFSGTLGSGETALWAYYPYSSTAGTDPTALNGVMPGVQTFNLTTGAINGDYKIGVPKSSSSSETEFTFKHLFSLLKFSIDASGTDLAGEHLEQIKLTVNNNRRLHGSFTFDATNGSYTLTGTTANANVIAMDWANTPSLANRTYTGYLSVIPEIRKGDKITVAIVTDSYQTEFEMTAIVDFEGSKIYNFPLTLSNHKDKWVHKTRPKMTAMSFTAKANDGKILSKEVYGSGYSTSPSTKAKDVTGVTLTRDTDGNFSAFIPYLFDRKLVPTFTVPAGCTVSIPNGPEVKSGETEVDFASVKKLRVTTAEGVWSDVNVTLENTGLPVVVIRQSTSGDFSEVYTANRGILANKFIEFMVRDKTKDWVEDDIFEVYNADGTVDVAPVNCGVRTRGNTTRGFDKKPFAIKLTDKPSVLGMPGHKRWCLLANRIDYSMLRNNVTYHMATLTQSLNGGDGMIWNPRGQNVELVFFANGVGYHVGNYYLCEQIKINKNRVAINDGPEDLPGSQPSDCGYLLELDTNYDEPYKFKTTSLGLPVMFKDDSENLTEAHQTYVSDIVNTIEKNLVNKNFTAAYELLDINSIIDQWLIYELTLNNEYGHPKSVYWYLNGTTGKKAGDGKVHAACVWDFDFATYQNPANRKAYGDYYYTEQPDYTRFVYEGYNQSGKKWIWIPRLVQDPNFRARIQERWKGIYATLATEIPAYIRQQGELNARSWEVNNAMWPAHYPSGMWNGDEKLATSQEVIENLVSCFTQRLEWLNSAITSGNIPTTSTAL